MPPSAEQSQRNEIVMTPVAPDPYLYPWPRLARKATRSHPFPSRREPARVAGRSVIVRMSIFNTISFVFCECGACAAPHRAGGQPPHGVN